VERECNGQRALRKIVKVGPMSPEENTASQKTYAKLSHPNICKCLASYFEEGKSLLYVDICDLGSFQGFVTRDKDMRFPGMFYWHVLKSTVQAHCHLEYGYPTLEEAVSTMDVKDGWDPIHHTDFNAENVFVKASSFKGAYPEIKVGGFDRCRTKTAYELKWPPGGEHGPLGWDKLAQFELNTLIRILLHEIIPDRVDESRVEVQDIRWLLRDSMDLPPEFRVKGVYVKCDARHLARQVLKTMEKNKIDLEKYPHFQKTFSNQRNCLRRISNQLRKDRNGSTRKTENGRISTVTR